MEVYSSIFSQIGSESGKLAQQRGLLNLFEKEVGIKKDMKCEMFISVSLVR